jgi:transcriptional regulator with PAS, ATPase and Fis domain
MELLRSWLRDNGERLRIRIRRSAFASGEQCKYRFEGILGESAALGTALDQAARVIPHPGVTVLITGETGTGKEVLARAIHYNGRRREAPFVDVNCIALPDQLLESELFGHEKGAFTDASAAKPGLMEEAHGGTLFLDEIGHLPIPLQGKLLRALEERRVRRVGGTRNIPIDVRIIAATHVNLREAVRRGEFREDLYYRLNVMPIELPPLRARRRDILVLARHFLARFTAEYGVQASLSPGAERALVTAAWPGNVRELRNSIERAVLLCDSGTLDAADFSVTDVQAPETERAFELPAPLGDIVRRATVATVDLCGGNKSEAARRLRISRTRLLRILDAADQTSVTASDDAESDLDAP